jgi:NADH dehydrogenase
VPTAVAPDAIVGATTAVRSAGRVLARPSTSLAPRIVILGGGFAGVTAALELAKRCAGLLPVHITLLSNQNFFLFTPMLAEAATGAVETRHILYPIRPLCGRWGIEFGEMQVEGIDLERRRVTVRHHRSPLRQQVHYDSLVLALGATPNVTIAPGAAEHALTFKGVGDAFRIRNRVIELFEAAALTDDPWIRRRLLTFVVVGAGHAGTELVAAVEELTRGILVRHYPRIPPETVRLVLVGSQVLPQTATNLAVYTKARLDGPGRLGLRRGARPAAGRPPHPVELRDLDRRHPGESGGGRAPPAQDPRRAPGRERLLRGGGRAGRVRARGQRGPDRPAQQ